MNYNRVPGNKDTMISRSMLVGSGTLILNFTDELAVVEDTIRYNVLQTIFVETLRKQVQTLSREACRGCNWEGYLLEEDHSCHIIDEELAWRKHWERAMQRINPALFFAMAQDTCKTELNIIVTFHWKLLVKRLFEMNFLDCFLLYLEMKEWHEYERIANITF